jgi:Leucine-rich repeat (LRR) protein
MIARRLFFCFVVFLMAGTLAACAGGSSDSSSPGDVPESTGEESPGATSSQPSSPVDRLHRQLEERNPSYERQGKFKTRNGEVIAAVLRNAGVSDLTPLRGLPIRGIDLYGNPVSDLEPLANLPLQAAYLEDTDVENLSALEGLSLQVLYLSNTTVSDLSPLEGMPLRELNLVGTPVKDLTPIADAPLQMLWLNDTPVEDIRPLEGSPIQSLTLKGTQVSDITTVRQMPNLKRLHIAGTPVTDLTPLKGLSLSRLVFTPENIERGLSIAREMDSLEEIGTTFNAEERALMTPEEFWQKYDQGTLGSGN